MDSSNKAFKSRYCNEEKKERKKKLSRSHNNNVIDMPDKFFLFKKHEKMYIKYLPRYNNNNLMRILKSYGHFHRRCLCALQCFVIL